MGAISRASCSVITKSLSPSFQAACMANCIGSTSYFFICQKRPLENPLSTKKFDKFNVILPFSIIAFIKAFKTGASSKSLINEKLPCNK